ncbi:MAG: 5-dehydro-2-deoxygluconokinase, partial [Candidatus Azotimanducaceae bacterium]
MTLGAPFNLDDLEILTFGRSSVDMYPEQQNVPLADVSTFRKSIGGSPTNVAVAAAR